MKKISLLLVVVGLVFAVGCTNAGQSKNQSDLNRATNYPMPECPESDQSVTTTETDLPAMQFPCLGQDGYVNLAGLPTGKPLIVSLWASWCLICEDDAPAFIAAKNKFKNLNLIGINYQDKETAAITSAAKWKLPFASIVDSDSSLQSFYQITGLPVTLVYDEKGILLARINGPVGTPEEFLNYLDTILNN